MYTLMHKYIQLEHRFYTTKTQNTLNVVQYKLKVRINLVFSSQNSEQCKIMNIMYLCGYILRIKLQLNYG